jgi:hypothetical protein
MMMMMLMLMLMMMMMMMMITKHVLPNIDLVVGIQGRGDFTTRRVDGQASVPVMRQFVGQGLTHIRV